jgi:hypothetical protein
MYMSMPVSSGLGAVHHAGHVAIGDQPDRGAGGADLGDHLLVAGAFQDADGDVLGRTALGGGQRAHPLGGVMSR